MKKISFKGSSFICEIQWCTYSKFFDQEYLYTFNKKTTKIYFFNEFLCELNQVVNDGIFNIM